MKKDIEIQISLDVVKQKLKSALEKGGEPHAELITKMIVENLEISEMGISQLLLAFMGIEETTSWVVGDECMVHPDKISSYSWERDLTEKAVPFYKGHVKGKITAINLRKKKPVTFGFTGIYSTNSTTVRDLSVDLKLSELKSDEDLKLVRPDLASLM